MTDAEYRMFCELVRSRCGLHFDEDSRFLVEKRVAKRIEDIEAGSFAAYHYMLREGQNAEEELSSIVDILTTNETYFFREHAQLVALIDEIIPELLIRRDAIGSKRPLSIWSAGCSSGEEPYSIVMMAMEAGLEVGRDLHVYASDIARSVLTRCRKGTYREASFRETPPEMREKYFTDKDGLSKIRDDVKRHVDVINLNLLDESKIALLGTMDVIICRNVIIYFDLEVKKRVMNTYYNKLRPGGYLLLGHSESLINVTSAFELRHLKNDLVYRRPAPGESVVDPWHEMARSAVETTDGKVGRS